MKLRNTKLKHNPFTFFKVKGQPKWLDAMKLHPPGPKPTRGVIPYEVGMFAESKNVVYKAPEIKYEEDQIRDVFYQQHPFELSRPRVLIEVDVQWDSIHGTPQVPLSGESVIQYTLALAKSKKLSLDQAYQLALQQFYEARQKQENQEYQARKKRIEELRAELLVKHKEEHQNKIQAGDIPEDSRLPELEYDPLLGLPFSSRFMELEKMELEHAKTLAELQL
jgi:hypothetical protein